MTTNHLVIGGGKVSTENKDCNSVLDRKHKAANTVFTSTYKSEGKQVSGGKQPMGRTPCPSSTQLSRPQG